MEPVYLTKASTEASSGISGDWDRQNSKDRNCNRSIIMPYFWIFLPDIPDLSLGKTALDFRVELLRNLDLRVLQTYRNRGEERYISQHGHRGHGMPKNHELEVHHRKLFHIPLDAVESVGGLEFILTPV